MSGTTPPLSPYSFRACTGLASPLRFLFIFPKFLSQSQFVIFAQVQRINRDQQCNRLFQITNLRHNSFILQQYVFYATILNMFRAARCSSSGGQIASPQPLVSSLYGCLQRVTIPEAVVIQFVLLRMSSVLLETC